MFVEVTLSGGDYPTKIALNTDVIAWVFQTSDGCEIILKKPIKFFEVEEQDSIIVEESYEKVKTLIAAVIAPR